MRDQADGDNPNKTSQSEHPAYPQNCNWKLVLPPLPENPSQFGKRPHQLTQKSFGNLHVAAGHTEVQIPGHPSILRSILNLDHPQLCHPLNLFHSQDGGWGIHRVRGKPPRFSMTTIKLAVILAAPIVHSYIHINSTKYIYMFQKVIQAFNLQHSLPFILGP